MHYSPPQMKRPSPVLWFCVFALVAPALAQTLPPPYADSSEDVVALSPFVVQSSEDETGYLAANTLAGTRLNTSLREVGAAVSVYTEDFLADIGALKLEDILTYTASTEGGGINGNFTGIQAENSDNQRDDPSAVNRVRALATATRTRDYFATDIPADTFNFGSLTVSRGPNAVLAGIGSAGGVIDASLRQAMFRDSNRVTLRIGSFDTHREELDINKVIVPGRVALRVSLLNEKEGFRQNPTYERDQRAYFATTVRLRESSPGGVLGRTTLRANFEIGEIEGVPPNQLTPIMSVQSWFENENPAINKWYANGSTQQIFNGAGVLIPNNQVGPSGIVAGFPIFRNWALIYGDPSSTTPSVGLTAPGLTAVQGFQGVIPGGTGNPSGFIRGTGDRNRARAGFFRTRLMDRNVFDFYNELLTGELDFRSQEFDALDVRIEQLMLDGKAGFELAFNHQNFERKRDFAFGNGDEEIYIDATKVLSVRSGTPAVGIPNPNFGRPFIISRDVFRDQLNGTERTSAQATAFLRHDFTRNKSGWARLLGRHTLSGLLFQTKIKTENQTYSSTWDPAGQLNPLSSIGVGPGLFASQVNAWFYLGDSMINANSLADLRLRPLSGARPTFGDTYTLQIYRPFQAAAGGNPSVPGAFLTGTSTPLRILSNYRLQDEEVTSGALTLQSHLLSDNLITLVGWRRDDSDALTSIDLPRLPTGDRDLSQVTLVPASQQSQESWTKSVVLRYPENWLGELPLGGDLRAYWNQSENFNPVGQRRNIYNEEVGSPSAETEEFGVMLSLFDGRVDLRVNRYETAIKNDSLAGVPNAYSYMNTMITRMVGAFQEGLRPADYGYVHPTFNTFEDVARAYFQAIPQRLRDNMGPEKNFDPKFVGTGANFNWESQNITNLSSISDTVSRGLEFEVVYNPTRSWRIAANASKQEAFIANAAVLELEAAREWISNVQTLYDGALSRGWRQPGASELPAIDQYRSETVFQIQAQNAKSGTATSEIRKWRGNLVTRYEFREGRLKGLSFGGAARWQDKIGIGYPLIRDENNQQIADIANPYFGPDDLLIDLSAGYKRRVRLWNTPVDWTIGLNVRNVNADDELIPIKANSDGSYGTVRIPPNRSWTLSNSFRF
jgi:outer membrane receptor protein involved in Fe transport